MKKITKYLATDGTEFGTKAKCKERDNLINICNGLVSLLPQLPTNDGCEFVNGNGYIQHDKDIFESFRECILTLANSFIDHKWIKEALAGVEMHPSFIGKVLYESDHFTLYLAWNRVVNTDKLYREFGQMYFALNPERAKLHRINL